jgi:hypothetical protein
MPRFPSRNSRWRPLHFCAITPDMPAVSSAAERYACGMKTPRKAKKRAKPDVYFDTLMWIHDGRRSWNRKPRKSSASKSVRSGRPGSE